VDAILDQSTTTTSRVCPNCDGALTADLTCWKCCERLCATCKRPTGSAFIDVCWSCWFQKEREAGA
jgi:hypothetical protein